MINREALKRTLALAGGGPEMRDLIIAMSGGFGGTMRKQALDDMAHILVELEKELMNGSFDTQKHKSISS